MTVNVVKMTHLSATELPRCPIFRQDGQLLIEYLMWLFYVVILCLNGCCHVTLIVLCNIATVHVVNMTHLSATELPRYHIFRQDGQLLIEGGYFKSKWLLPCMCMRVCVFVCMCVRVCECTWVCM